MLCPKCGAEQAWGKDLCPFCGTDLSNVAAPVPKREPANLASWSLWLGFLGFVSCGLTAIIGFVVGIVSIWQSARRPAQHNGLVLPIVATVISLVMIFAPVEIGGRVLSNAKEGARKAYCLNSLKQCSQALRMYCDDYDGMLPSSVLNTKTKNFPDFGCRLCVDGKYPPSDGAKYTWPQILNDNMRYSGRVFCPDDSIGFEPTKNPIVSYWYKYAMDLAWTDPNLKKRHVTDCAWQEDQIAFFEHSGFHVGYYGDHSGLKRGVQINASFMDTHVETIIVPDSGPPEDAPVDAPAGSMSHCEPFFYNNYVDSQGRQHAQNPLRPNTKTGLCIDPANNYDKL